VPASGRAGPLTNVGERKEHHWQISFGFGGTAGGNPFLMPAGFVSGSINAGITSDGQLFVQVQRSLLTGLGVYGGVGGQVGLSESNSELPVGGSRERSLEAQFNYGWGRSGGLTADIGRNNGSISMSPTRLKGGAGYGIMGGGGMSWTTTWATPSIGSMIIRAWSRIKEVFREG